MSRKAICIYCGLEFIYDDTEAGQQAAWDALKAHDAVCRSNPLVLEIERLRSCWAVVHEHAAKTKEAADHWTKASGQNCLTGQLQAEALLLGIVTREGAGKDLADRLIAAEAERDDLRGQLEVLAVANTESQRLAEAERVVFRVTADHMRRGEETWATLSVRAEAEKVAALLAVDVDSCYDSGPNVIEDRVFRTAQEWQAAEAAGGKQSVDICPCGCGRERRIDGVAGVYVRDHGTGWESRAASGVEEFVQQDLKRRLDAGQDAWICWGFGQAAEAAGKANQ